MSSQESRDFDFKTYLNALTGQPGVYRMYGARDVLLYVGKAKNLKRRVSTYFLRASGNPRIEAMVDQVHRIEVSVTHTEDEALLLEATLIKELAPRYNVLLRDDKSYPYVRITRHAYPRITFYRGGREGRDRYFGPFPSSASVREAVSTIQRVFLLRPCSDRYFSTRRRPCLQYQIGRCSAPCAGLVSQENYSQDVNQAIRLLSGHSDALVSEMGDSMERASESLEFERAARIRDQIAALQRVREHRNITGGAKNLDVVALAPHTSKSAVALISVRNGLNLGHASHIPNHPPGTDVSEVMSAFLAQYYLERRPPTEILVSVLPKHAAWLERTFSERSGHRIRISRPARGARRRLLQMCEQTATQALTQHLAASASMDQRLMELQSFLGLTKHPQRMECFDISHTRGERAVASCVVFNGEGPLKAGYRRFNIEGITPGDDYAALHQAISRRYARIKAGESAMPDILFIDGGKGQVASAADAIRSLDVDEQPVIVGISKGPSRRPGSEQLHIGGRGSPRVLAPDSAALHFIQSIRDEAHRFAVTGHRNRRDRARTASELERIEGLGPVRRRALLKALGGLQEVRRADVDALTRVTGVNRRLAERIYAHFH